MARGWESKSVEEQQSQASATRTPLKPQLSAQELIKARQREGLMLSRKRVVQQLEAAQNAVHRQMLEKALAELDAQLARLG